MRKFLIIFIISFVLLSGVTSVLAVTTWKEGEINANIIGQIDSAAKTAGVGKAENPQLIITNIIKIILSITGMLFIGLLVMGGFFYITAEGEDEKIKKGTDIMKASIIGIIIILSAYAIVLFVSYKFDQVAFIENSKEVKEPETGEFFGIEYQMNRGGEYIGQ